MKDIYGRILINQLYLCIDYENITFVIDKYIAWDQIPYFILVTPESPFFIGLFKSQCSHIGVKHYLSSRMGISNSWLYYNRLNGTSVKPCKTIKRISCVWKYCVVHKNLMQ